MEYNKKEQLLDKVSGLKYINPSEQGFYHNKALDTACVHIKEFFDSEFVPEVPQYVADWYEDNKGNLDYNLWNYIMDWEYTKEDNFKKWLKNSKEAFQTIINMHQFGYKIKKEKKYKVKFKNVQKGSESFKFDTIIGKWYFGFNQESSTTRLYHTKEELIEAGFEEVFDSSLFEVEEAKSE